MNCQTSKRHHYVPKFLLKPWLVKDKDSQLVLNGLWWDARKNQLACKKRGLNAFCCQDNLLSLKQHTSGTDAIERDFFGHIDEKGARARELLIAVGPAALDSEQRCDFARLLLSLEARRPAHVDLLRKQDRALLVNALDGDPEIREAFAAEDLFCKPSEYAELQFRWNFEDIAICIVQNLVDNPKVGRRLINAKWEVRHLETAYGSLVTSDRPLILFHGYDKPGGTWLLPLTPFTAFIACNDQRNLARIMQLSDQRFVKAVNISTAYHAERFVFYVQSSHEKWLAKHLKKATARLAIDPIP